MATWSSVCEGGAPQPDSRGCVCARAPCLCVSGAAQFHRASRAVREGWLGSGGLGFLGAREEGGAEARAGVL